MAERRSRVAEFGLKLAFFSRAVIGMALISALIQALFVGIGLPPKLLLFTTAATYWALLVVLVLSARTVAVVFLGEEKAEGRSWKFSFFLLTLLLFFNSAMIPVGLSQNQTSWTLFSAWTFECLAVGILVEGISRALRIAEE